MDLIIPQTVTAIQHLFGYTKKFIDEWINNFKVNHPKSYARFYDECVKTSYMRQCGEMEKFHDVLLEQYTKFEPEEVGCHVLDIFEELMSSCYESIMYHVCAHQIHNDHTHMNPFYELEDFKTTEVHNGSTIIFVKKE